MYKSIKTVESIKRNFDNYISDANQTLIDLKGLTNIPDNEKNSIENFTKSLESYVKSLKVKRDFIEENEVDIVSYNEQFLKGNIFAINKIAELNGKFNVYTENIKYQVNDLKQWISKLQNDF